MKSKLRNKKMSSVADRVKARSERNEARERDRDWIEQRGKRHGLMFTCESLFSWVALTWTLPTSVS